MEERDVDREREGTMCVIYCNVARNAPPVTSPDTFIPSTFYPPNLSPHMSLPFK